MGFLIMFHKRSTRLKNQVYTFIAVLSVVWLLACSHAIRMQPSSNLSSFLWPMFGFDQSHTNAYTEEFSPPLQIAWEQKLSSAPAASSIFAYGIVFVPTQEGRIFAYDVTNGREIGYLKIKAGQNAAPVYFQHSLLFAMESGKPNLYCYNITDGKYNWNKNIEEINSPLLLDMVNLYVATLKGTVLCLDPNDGRSKWQWEGKEPLYAAPVCVDSVIVVGSIDGTITALNSQSGKEEWQVKEKRTLRGSPAVNGNKILWGTVEGSMYALSTRTGEKIWEFQTGAKIYSTPATVDKYVVFGCNNGKIYALQTETGTLLWEFQTLSVVNTPPIIVGTTVYCGSLDHKLYAVDLSTGKSLWSFDAGGQIISAPIFTGSHILVATQNKKVYAFRKESKSSTQ